MGVGKVPTLEGIMVVGKKPQPKVPRPRVKVDRRQSYRVGEPEVDEGETYSPVVGTEFYVGHANDGHFVYDPNGETGWEVLPGFQRFSDRAVMLRELWRHIHRDETPVPVLRGKSDPYVEGCVLVPASELPLHPRIPLIADEVEVFARYNKEARAVVCAVVIDVEGVHYGWDMCGECARRIHYCRCRNGASPPRGIRYCLTRSADNWGDDRPRIVPRSDPQVGRLPGSDRKATSAPAPAPTVKEVEPPAVDEPDTTGLLSGLDQGNLDMGAVAEAAAKSAEESTKKMRRIIKRKKP